jgi:hypothetical protein
VAVLFFILACLAIDLPASGQTSASPTKENVDLPSTLQQTLERLYEEETAKIISKMIQAKEFFVTVSVKPGTKAPEVLPYEPIQDALGKLRSLAPLEWNEYTQQVRINVALSGRFKKTFTAKLQAILSQKFGLKPEQGDQVLISSEWLPTPPDQDATREIARAELSAAEARRRATGLTDERDKLLGELSQMSSKVDGLEKDLKNRESELAELQAVDRIPFWRKYLDSGHYIVIALLGILALSLIAMAASRTIGRGISSVAKSLQAVSGSLTTINGGEPSRKIAGPSGPLALPEPTDNSENDLATLYEQVLNIHSEISSTLTEENEYVILSQVTTLCQATETVSEAVATMEILGRDRANELFAKLGNQSQQAILEFLRYGRYPKQKVAMLLAAGERLKTRLFAAGFQNTHLGANKNIIKVVSNLTPDELVAVVQSIEDPRILSRLFMHFESHSLQEIFENLSTVGQGENSSFDRAADAFAAIPELDYDHDLDQRVSSAVEATLLEMRKDKGKVYLTYYAQVLESVSDDVSEKLISRIRSANNDALAASLEKQVVTFGSMTKLTPEFFAIVLESLNNKALAAICVHEKTLAPRILKNLNSLKKELLQEEISTLEGAGRLEIERQIQKSKKLCIAKIKELKAKYGLSAMTATAKGEILSQSAGEKRVGKGEEAA